MVQEEVSEPDVNERLHAASAGPRTIWESCPWMRKVVGGGGGGEEGGEAAGGDGQTEVSWLHEYGQLGLADQIEAIRALLQSLSENPHHSWP